jgi:hypothetical protein
MGVPPESDSVGACYFERKLNKRKNRIRDMKSIINKALSFAILILIVAAIQYYRPCQNHLLSASNIADYAKSWSSTYEGILPTLSKQFNNSASLQIKAINQLIEDSNQKKEKLNTFDFVQSKLLETKIEALEKIKNYLGGEPLAAEEFEVQRKYV